MADNFPCRSRPRAQQCDAKGRGDFMGHTCHAPAPEISVDYLLNVLGEEASEITQAACKAYRFGPDDCRPGTTVPNRIQIAKEIGDVLGMMDMLRRAGIDIPQEDIDAARASKPRRVKEYHDLYFRNTGVRK